MIKTSAKTARRGTFIVIDGMDGSGKGTQIRLLQEKLTGHPVIFTREPGGTPKAEEIRKLLLNKDGPASDPLKDFWLFWEARESHVEELIGPSLEQGTHVLCDRYDSSTHAFQIHGEQQNSLLDLFKEKRETLPPKYHPHAYIILDLPAEVAYGRRLKDSVQEKTRFDVKPIEYHARVRDGFLQFGEYLKDSKSDSICYFIDADRPVEAIHADIWKIVSRELGI
ncbi:dTMP kinase [Candidatus Kaiserbacteria bacterium]|nr:dTMP kinase [Candidatus Kaiserbacteria bacterium]